MDVNERFDFLLDESSLTTKKELSELIGCFKKVRSENQLLASEIAKLRASKKTFWNTTLKHYDGFDTAGFWFSIWVLPTLFAALTMSILLICLHEPTNQYMLNHNSAKSCTEVEQVISWGPDKTVSECFRTSEEARDFMESLQQLQVEKNNDQSQ